MKKTLFAIAIALVGIVGLSASAQVQNKMYQPTNFTDFAFEGVLLEPAQQQRLDSLHAAVKASSRPAAQQRMDRMRQMGDSLRVNPRQKHSEMQREAGPMQRNMRPAVNGVMPGVAYVAKVKEILTPEQFDVFLTNVSNMPEDVVYDLVEAPSAPNRMQPRGGQHADCPHSKDGNCQQGQMKHGDCQQGKDCQKDGKDCKKDGKDCKKDCKKDGKDCKKDCKKDGKDCKKDCKDCKDCKKGSKQPKKK